LKITPSSKPRFKFADTKNIPGWATGYIQSALDNGLLTGYPDNTFKARINATRAEICAVESKMLKKLGK
ncbi:MAG: S-layer homology domain-containing protein, partial [Acidobacteriota bacterium]